jgi:hypothetical protein
LSLPIFELDYEALVGDTDATLVVLRRFLGLPEAADASREAGAEVFATASIWQARQQVHRRSLSRWKRYAQYLPALREAVDGAGFPASTRSDKA